MHYYKKTESIVFYIGLLKRFQGLGFTISFDNPITYNEYVLIEIQILWFKCYLIIEREK